MQLACDWKEIECVCVCVCVCCAALCACCGRDYDDEIKAFILAKPETFSYKQLSFFCEASWFTHLRFATSQTSSETRN
jgi:hypothetical protein